MSDQFIPQLLITLFCVYIIACLHLSFSFIPFHSLSFPFIHFHSLSFTFIHFHSLSFTFIHFHTLSYPSSLFNSLSLTFVPFHPVTVTVSVTASLLIQASKGILGGLLEKERAERAKKAEEMTRHSRFGGQYRSSMASSKYL